MAITFDDFTAALNSLRQEIPGMIAPGIVSLRTDIDAAMRCLNDAALVEIRQHSSSTAQQVTSEVDARFQSAAVGFQAEQNRLDTIVGNEHNRLTSLVDKLSIDVKAAVEKVPTVADGKLNEVATALIEQQATMDKYEKEAVKKVATVHQILRSEVSMMHASITEVNAMTLSRMDQLERGGGASAQRFDMSGGSSAGEARG